MRRRPRAPNASRSPSMSVQDTQAPGRASRLAVQVREVFEDVAGFDIQEEDGGANCIELGLDSLMLTQVALQLQKTFAVKITFRQRMGDCASLGRLVAALDAQLPAEPRRAAPAVVAAPAPAPVAAAAPALVPAAAAAASPAMVARLLPAPLPVAARPGGDSSAVRTLIAQQMQLMSQQLALLAGAPAAVRAPVAAAPAAPVAAPAATAAPPDPQPAAPVQLAAAAAAPA